MRQDLVRIWQAEGKTFLFNTHDIEEAVQLGDRVLVMGKRPSTIIENVVIELPRSRDLDSLTYLAKPDHIFHIMGLDGHAGMPGSRDG